MAEPQPADDWVDVPPAGDDWVDVPPQEKLGAVEGAFEPITSLPRTLHETAQGGLREVKEGVKQLGEGNPWGAGHVALGSLGYLTSPITAPLRSIAGRPVERAVTAGAKAAGLSPETSERLGSALGAGAETAAGFALPVPKGAPKARPSPPEAPSFGVTFGKHQAPEATFADQRAVSDALRGRSGEKAYGEAQERYANQQADVTAAKDVAAGRLHPQGDVLAEDPHDAGEVVQRLLQDQATNAEQARTQQLQQLNTEREAIRTSHAPNGRVIAQTPEEAADVVQGALSREEERYTARRDAAYEAANDAPGQIKPKAFINVKKRIQQTFSNPDHPFLLSPENTPNTLRVLDRLSTELEEPARAAVDPAKKSFVPFTPARINNIRKILNSYWTDANNAARSSNNYSDVSGVGRVIDEFDNIVSRGFRHNYEGGNGPQVAQLWDDARAAHRDLRQTFSPQGKGDVVGPFIQKVLGQREGQALAPEQIVSGLTGSNGAQIGRRLIQIFGADSPEVGAVKNLLFHNATERAPGLEALAPGKVADNIDKLRNSDIGKLYFSPQERAAMGQHSTSTRAYVPTADTSVRGRMLAKAQNMSPQQLVDAIMPRAGAYDKEESIELARHVMETGRPEQVAAVKQGIFKSLVEPPGAESSANTVKRIDAAFRRGQDLMNTLYTPAEQDMIKEFRNMHNRLKVPQHIPQWSGHENYVSQGLKYLGFVIGQHLAGATGLAHSPIVGDAVGLATGTATGSIREAAAARKVARLMPTATEQMVAYQKAVKAAERWPDIPAYQKRAAVSAVALQDGLKRLGIDLSKLTQSPVPAAADQNQPKRAEGGAVNRPFGGGVEGSGDPQLWSDEAEAQRQMNETATPPLPADAGMPHWTGPAEPTFADQPLPKPEEEHPREPKRSIADKLVGSSGPRFQPWPERLIRSAVTAPGEAYQTGQLVNRDEYGNIVGSEPVVDPRTGHVSDTTILRAQDIAGLAGGTSAGAAEEGALGMVGGKLAQKSLPLDPDIKSQLAAGNGLRAYHGTGKDTPHSNWFTIEPEQAVQYAQNSAEAYGGEPKVLERQLDIKKPFVTDPATMEGIGYDHAAIQQLKNAGYDSVMRPDGVEMFVIDPSKVREPGGQALTAADRKVLDTWVSRHYAVDHATLAPTLSKLPSYEGGIFRGVPLSPEDAAKFKPGMVVAHEKFIGASKDSSIADTYAMGGNNRNLVGNEIPTVFHYKNTTAHDLSQAPIKNSMAVQGDEEVIIPPGNFRVESVQERKNPETDRPVRYVTLASESGKPGAALAALEHPFYSAVERAVQNAPQNKATAEQWTGWLRNQPGITSEELNRIGMPEGKGPVTKDQLLSHIGENKLQLEEKEYQESDTALPSGEALDQEADAATYSDWEDDKGQRLAHQFGHLPADALDRMQQRAYSEWRRTSEGQYTFNTNRANLEESYASQQHDSTQYSQWQLPGGENYRELLMKVPGSQTKTIWQLRHKSGTEPYGEFPTREAAEDSVRRTGAGDHVEVLSKPKIEKSPLFKSSHWNEPNVLMHLRTNDRQIPGVGKSLHLEEVQSDWHQKGRKEGYDQPFPHAAELERLTHQKEDMINSLPEVRALPEGFKVRPNRPRGYWVSDPNGDSLAQGPNRTPIQGASPEKAAARAVQYLNSPEGRELQLADALEPIQNRISELKYQARQPSVPDAPFKTSWPELGLKRALVKAAREGYDAISWTPGEEQAKRYDLSKHVSEIKARKNDDGTIGLQAQTPQGKIGLGNKLQPSEVADHVGKELAEKIISDLKSVPPTPKFTLEKYINRNGGKDWNVYADGKFSHTQGGESEPAALERAERLWNEKNNLKTYSGLDLKVGGEGMKAFYDKMLPNIANKLGKKYGAQVEWKNLKHAANTVDTFFVRNGNINGEEGIRALTTDERQLKDGWYHYEEDPENGTGPFPSKEAALKAADAGQSTLQVPVLRLTPKLKEQALQGLPLFSDSGEAGAPLSALEHPFYSAVEKAVQNAPQNKATAEQWTGWLRNQPGIKSEELDRIGMPEGKGSITKDQLLSHIGENKLNLEETEYVERPKDVPQEQLERYADEATYYQWNESWGQRVEDPFEHLDSAELEELKQQEYRDWLETPDGQYAYDQQLEVAREELQDQQPNSTKFSQSQLQLPGGENYRELLMKLPGSRIKETWRLRYTDGSGYIGAFSTRAEAEDTLRAIDTSTSDNLLTHRLEVASTPKISAEPLFRSLHWPEPNVFTHLRMNDRNIPDVGKSLHLEELQSDWHQKGREEGYQQKIDPAVAKTYQDTNKEWTAVVKAMWDEAANALGDASPEQQQEFVNQLKAANPQYQAIEQRAYEAQLAYVNAQAASADAVPDAPFKTTWPELGLKRAIVRAAREGYDAISWTPGEEQAKRYDLSKHVDTLSYDPKTNMLRGDKSTDDLPGPLFKKKVPPDKLVDFVGKEVAARLLKAPTDAFGHHILAGENLKLGGEGMKAFYDKMLPNIANKFGKKYGAQVEWKPLGVGTKGNPLRKHADGSVTGGVQVPVLRLTPKLKEQALQGLPLFSDSGEAGAPLSALEKSHVSAARKFMEDEFGVDARDYSPEEVLYLAHEHGFNPFVKAAQVPASWTEEISLKDLESSPSHLAGTEPGFPYHPNYIYHGTSSKHLPNIQKHGLLAGSYITTEPSVAWEEATRTTHGFSGDKEAVGGKPVVLAVDKKALKDHTFYTDPGYDVAKEEYGRAAITRDVIPPSSFKQYLRTVEDVNKHWDQLRNKPEYLGSESGRAGAPLSALEKSQTAYHGSKAAGFEKFKIPDPRDEFMIDRAIGVHVAKDPNLSDNFTRVENVHGSPLQEQRQGSIYPLEIPPDSKFLTLDQSKGGFDENAISNLVYKTAFKQDPEMFGRWLSRRWNMDSQEGQQAAKTILSGKPYADDVHHLIGYRYDPKLEKRVRKPVLGFDDYADREGVVSMFGMDPQAKADRARAVELFHKEMERQGYVGLKYKNTSPMEMHGVTDPTSYVIFNPSKHIRSKYTESPMARGGAVKNQPYKQPVVGKFAAQNNHTEQQRAAGGRVVAANIDSKPSAKQKHAGNYKKDHVTIHGLDITVENARGGKRSGKAGGKAWEVKMPCAYGYFKRTEGADNDHVDVYLGPHTKSPKVFVLDQVNADTKAFDEHKVFLNFGAKQQVINTYLKCFSDGRGKARMGHLTEMTVLQLKDWLAKGDTKHPLKKITREAFSYTPTAKHRSEQCRHCLYTSGNTSPKDGCGLYRLLNQRCPDDFELNEQISLNGWCSGFRPRK